MEKDIHIKIECFVGGSMSLEEQKAFEQELLLDNELLKEVNLYKSINHHLNSESCEPIEAPYKNKEELEAYFKSPQAQELKQKLKRTEEKYNASQQRNSLKYIAAAALVLFIGAVSYFSLKQPSYEELYVEFYSEKGMPSIVTRGNGKEKLSTGAIAYKEKNYKQALQLFNEYIFDQNPENLSVYIFKGMTHLELNEFDKALESFDQLINSNSIDRSKGFWYKCLVYLKTEDTTNLKLTLKKILQNPNHYNYEKAKKLLERL